MMQLTLQTLIMIFSFIFFQMNHPLAMGLMLLIQTTLISLITGMMTMSFWFSYILFLVFLGGMLVLFIYVTSLASNEMFSFSTKTFTISLLLILLILMMMLIMDKNILTFNSSNMDNKTIYSMINYFSENSLTLNKLYNYPTNFITIMLMNYLLITLIAIVKITKMSYGPLRPMIN